MVGVQFDRFWQKSDPHLLSTCGTFPSTPSERSLMPLLCQEWGVFVFSLLFFSSVFPLNTRTVQYSTWMAYRKAGFLFAACVCWFGLGRAEQGSTPASLRSAVSRNTCGVIGMVQKSRNAAGMGWAPRTCMGGGVFLAVLGACTPWASVSLHRLEPLSPTNKQLLCSLLVFPPLWHQLTYSFLWSELLWPHFHFVAFSCRLHSCTF